MHNDTRRIYNEYQAQVAEANGVESAREQFNVEPVIAQEFEDVIREEAGFLNRVNHETMDNPQGETLGMDVTGPIASVTDTTGTEERTAEEIVKYLKRNSYHCQQVDFDKSVRYSVMDKWRHADSFEERYARQIARQVARDRIMMGWNGTHRAVLKSDKLANPKLQDVAEGWLHKITDRAPERVNDTAFTIGASGDYKNLDSAAYSLLEHKMADHHSEDTDLVCIIGRQLLFDKYFGLMNDNNAATERLALDVLFTTRQVAGMPAVIVPFFPKDAMLITRLDNLSIYTQEGTTRRHMIDNPKKNRVEDYFSQNTDYPIEDYECLAYVPPGKITAA